MILNQSNFTIKSVFLIILKHYFKLKINSMTKIRIISGTTSFFAQLSDTPTAKAIISSLPLKGSVNTWGEEIYFITNLHLNSEKDAKEEVEIGDLGFWPIGSAFCIFFGKTPISTSSKPKAYSPVNVFGKIISNIADLNKIKEGDEIIVSLIEE